MSFKFSADDFIAAGETIAKLIKGLRETGGFKSDYQELVRELQDLDKALKHVDRLKAGNRNNLDIIKCAASSCRHSLERFLNRISRYEYSLGPTAFSGIKAAGRKIHLSLQQVLKLVQELRVMAPAVDTRFTYFQAPVKVEDALGRVFPVPSEYSFGDLQALIQHRFKVGPGHSQVSNGNYEIFNSKNKKKIMSEEGCNIRGLSPGGMLTMAIILDEIVKPKDNTCPNAAMWLL
ncbi:hypothetical protein DID88_002917 [Monilinia fructigena]|uniref:Ubiquitin-like domain-containing protein n=1 Tax=Monilinia fructigena TaxID=38457 RepID=A0A395IPP1_9HELO|nr:hypothetical protein DID88_002917 [Monilinia fructigena]